MIDYHPNAPDGSVETLDRYSIDTFTPDDAILCRITAPLVSMAFGFIRRQTGVRILGREIGTNLVTLITKMKATTVDDLSDKLHTWCHRETSKLYARGHDASAAAIQDKVDCINIFIDELDESNRTTSALTDNITSLFSDNNKGLLTLCTVHKAKGLEWSRVFILDRDLYMPSKFATQPWQQKQETNLIYVAVTRAKLDLRWIKSGCWRQTNE